MSRLYDRIMASRSIHKETKASFRKNPPIILSADNVAQYVADNPDAAPKWDEQPIYRSPFEYIFIEAQRPTSHPELPYAWGIGFKWKAIIDAFTRGEDLRSTEYEADGVKYSTTYDMGTYGDWIPMTGDIFVQETTDSDVYAEWSVSFTLDINGNFDPDPTQHFVFENTDNYTRQIPDPSAYKGYRYELTPKGERRVFYLVTPLMMALTLINCKNVELIDFAPLHYENRIHQKKHHEPLVNFKTIKVNPMRTVKHVTDPDAQQQTTSSQPRDLPLTIWRGHFKDYRDGKGLFGNPALKGIYWWDQHVRGSIENGANVNDYEVTHGSEDVTE